MNQANSTRTERQHYAGEIVAKLRTHLNQKNLTDLGAYKKRILDFTK